MNMLGASCLESIGCAGRGGQNLHCMEVVAKIFITYELWVEMAELARMAPARYSLHGTCWQNTDSVRLIRLRKNGASGGFCTGSMELIHILIVASGA
jgi:hypothetical protein